MTAMGGKLPLDGHQRRILRWGHKRDRHQQNNSLFLADAFGSGSFSDKNRETTMTEIAEHDPLPKLENAVKVPSASQRPVDIPTMVISEAILPRKPGATSDWERCFDAAALMVTEDAPRSPKATLEGRYGRIWVSTGVPSYDGRTRSDKASAERARAYVDQMLDRRLRVLVGVAWGNKVARTKATDHYLAIVGRGYEADGRVYYDFRDPGSTREEYSKSKFYVDGVTGKMFRLGAKPALNMAPLGNYEVTEVRTYKEFPPAP
jgi:hypothetical protein